MAIQAEILDKNEKQFIMRFPGLKVEPKQCIGQPFMYKKKVLGTVLDAFRDEEDVVIKYSVTDAALYDEFIAAFTCKFEYK